ncbi:hypothetical protein [uncultured Rhodospira sp.]|uniref:hypothetical protein n=1 Tax=uncultured Rhodospira sp. TaxID=1936189 RepID=UPI00262F7E9A|nr:hypothetical protein [uncultured Rhodospira sp.]
MSRRLAGGRVAGRIVVGLALVAGLGLAGVARGGDGATFSEVLGALTARLAPGQAVMTAPPDALRAAARSLALERAGRDGTSLSMMGTVAQASRPDAAGRHAVVEGTRSALNELVGAGQLDPARRDALMAAVAGAAGVQARAATPGAAQALPGLDPLPRAAPSVPAVTRELPPPAVPTMPGPAETMPPAGMAGGQPSPYPAPPGYAPPYAMPAPGVPQGQAQYGPAPEQGWGQGQAAPPNTAPPYAAPGVPPGGYAAPSAPAPSYPAPSYPAPSYPGTSYPAPGQGTLAAPATRVDPSIMDLPPGATRPAPETAASGF